MKRRVVTAQKNFRSGRWHYTAFQFFSGEIVNKSDDEGRLLKTIVNCGLKVMKNVPLEVAKHPVGLKETLEQLQMITLESAQSHQNVQIMGILGMCGKTTLAKELYNNKCSYWLRSHFLFDVRDVAAKSLLHDKQKKSPEDLVVKDVPFDNIGRARGILASCVRSVPVLIILDDMDNGGQLDALLPSKDSLRWGSLVIGTTRESEVLRSWGISSYKMRTLDPSLAKQLFCWHAFLQPSPLEGFEDLVKKLLNACNGLPVSLKVFGGQLYDNSNKDYWESQLHKISKILPGEIKQSLKVSYNALDEEEKQMFLDAACFSIGEDKDLAIGVWDGSGWSGLHSWKKLVKKCLLELNEKNCMRMHDHLKDLGREIANQQSPYRLLF